MGFFSDFFGGGEKLQAPYQPPLNVQNFMQPVPVSEMQKVSIYGDLLKDKQGYDNAAMNIDGWQRELATPNLSDEDKQRALGNIKGWEQVRDAHAKSAESTRQTAAQLGIDVSDYGSDKTLAQAGQAFQNYRNVGVKNFLNLPSLSELEENRYMELRSQGASPGQANRIVGRERNKFRDQLTRQYTDALIAYGKNPDGSLDQEVGMQLLGGLAEVNPTRATMFYTGFATPQKVFDANQAQALTLLGNTAAMDRLAAQIKANWQNAEANRAANWSNLVYTTDAASKETALNRETQFKIAMLRNMNGGSNNSGNDKMLQEINGLFMAIGGGREGLTDEEKQNLWDRATDTWLKKNYPQLYNAKMTELQDWSNIADALGMNPEKKKKFLLDKAGWKPEETSKNNEELDKLGNLFQNRYTDIEGAIKAGDKKLALERIEQMRGWLRDDSDIAKLLDKESYDLQLRKLDMYTKQINGEYESDEGKTQFIKDRYFIEYGVQPSPDEIQRIMTQEEFFGVPMRPKVKTPPLAPTTPSSSAWTQPPPWQSPTNHAGALPYGYGTGAWQP